MHLRPEELVELVDLADGAPSEAVSDRLQGHLALCAACRRQLADLRATLAAVSDDTVPEPSPLFWDHFSRRVQQSVAAQGRPDRAWLPWLFPAAAMAMLLVFMLVPGRWRSIPPPGDIAVAVAPPPAARETLTDDVTDPSLTLVADLADGIDWESVREAGLAPRGSAEHAVTHLSDRELRELQRLLQVELAHATD